MVFQILIAGAGQIGSRHLQGLAKVDHPLRVQVYDISADALARAESRLREVSCAGSHIEVSFHEKLDSTAKDQDLVIVATAADIRPSIIDLIVSHADVRHWIFEKVLAQNDTDIVHIEKAIAGSIGAWVNTNRRTMSLYENVGTQITQTVNARPLRVHVGNSNWGLACNSVHFLDMVSWWTGETLVEVDTSSLLDSWEMSKRHGFWEVTGALTAKYSGGSELVLEAHEDGTGLTVNVASPNGEWVLSQMERTAHGPDGKITGAIEMQSQMTGGVVRDILNTGQCRLPTLRESKAIHEVYLNAMLEHWRTHHDPDATKVPIT